MLYHVVSRFRWKTSRHGTYRLQQPPGSWGLPVFIFCGTAKNDEFEFRKEDSKAGVFFLGGIQVPQKTWCSIIFKGLKATSHYVQPILHVFFFRHGLPALCDASGFCSLS